MSFEDQTVHLHFLNGKVIAGSLTAIFQPTDALLVVTQGKKLVSYSLKDLAYVLFLGNDSDQPYADFISYREEGILHIPSKVVDTFWRKLNLDNRIAHHQKMI